LAHANRHKISLEQHAKDTVSSDRGAHATIVDLDGAGGWLFFFYCIEQAGLVGRCYGLREFLVFLQAFARNGRQDTDTLGTCILRSWIGQVYFVFFFFHSAKAV